LARGLGPGLGFCSAAAIQHPKMVQNLTIQVKKQRNKSQRKGGGHQHGHHRPAASRSDKIEFPPQRPVAPAVTGQRPAERREKHDGPDAHQHHVQKHSHGLGPLLEVEFQGPCGVFADVQYVQMGWRRQQADAQRQADIARQAQGAQAAKSGAFGGSGDYLMRAQAAANLARQKGDITAQGLQAAYQNAQQQFNQSQAQNLAANQLNAQQQQFGAGLGLQGLQTALSGAQGLGQLGQQQYQQNMGINALQNQYGLQQQAQMQKDIDVKYQDYLNAQNYPYKNLSFMSDIIRGVPLTQTGSSIYQAPPSTAQTIASLGLGAAGISKLMADGGVASSGGIGALALNNLV